MPITVSWYDDDQTIMLQSCIGDWTWDDYLVSIDALAALANSTTERVDYIMDITDTVGIPLGLPLKYIRKARAKRPPNLGIIVVVGASPIQKSVFNMARYIDRQYNNTRFLDDTLNDAVRRIIEHRQSSA